MANQITISIPTKWEPVLEHLKESLAIFAGQNNAQIFQYLIRDFSARHGININDMLTASA